MTVNNNRKRLKFLGDLLLAEKELTKEERKHLGRILANIGKGASADEEFGLNYKQGKSKADEDRRENLGMIFMWVSCAIQADNPEHLTPARKVTAALKQAAALSNSAKYPIFKPISHSALRKAWYDPKFAHLKRTHASTVSPDFPDL